MWKNIKCFEGLYKVSIFGEIKSLKKKKGFCIQEDIILKQKTNKFGYSVVSLSDNGKKKDFMVHRLVAEAFIKNKNNKKQVNHKNGIKSDNNVNNLEWMTPSENIKHSYTIGLKSMRGEKHNNRKLNWENVLYIRNSNLTGVALSRKFNVATSLISKIKNNLNWISKG